jgi:hypothetical protein
VCNFITILLTLLNSQFQLSNSVGKNILSLYSLVSDPVENTCYVLLRMCIHWPVTQHRAGRGINRKILFCCPLQPPDTDHRRKHSLSTVVWCHHVRQNVPNARCITMVLAWTTENTAPLLSRMRVYWPVTIFFLEICRMEKVRIHNFRSALHRILPECSS